MALPATLLRKKSVPIHTGEPDANDDLGADRDGEKDSASGSVRDYNDSDRENSGVHENDPSFSLSSSQQLKE